MESESNDLPGATLKKVLVSSSLADKCSKMRDIESFADEVPW